jgi:hypothetical protein
MNTITSEAFGDAKVTEYSHQKMLLRVARQIPVGTTVKVRLQGALSRWKVFSCVSDVNCYHLGLELADHRQ